MSNRLLIFGLLLLSTQLLHLANASEATIDITISAEDLEDDSEESKEDISDPFMPDEKADIEFSNKEVVKRKEECNNRGMGINQVIIGVKKKTAQAVNTTANGRFGLALDRDAAIQAHCNTRRAPRQQLIQEKHEIRAKRQRLNQGPMGITELRGYVAARKDAKHAAANATHALQAAQQQLKTLVDSKAPKVQLDAQRKLVNQARSRNQRAIKKLQNAINEHKIAKRRFVTLHPKNAAVLAAKQKLEQQPKKAGKVGGAVLKPILAARPPGKPRGKRAANNSTTLRADGKGVDAKATSYEECMTIACLCKFWNGTASQNCTYKGVPLTKSIRKEYHMLTDSERQRYHAALTKLKEKGVYDVFATFHAAAAHAVNAHNGPAFLLWHRELLKRYELELRKIDPLVGLPYWLSSVNNYAPKQGEIVWRSQKQITFSDNFMGTPVGAITAGPAAGWNNTAKTGPLTRNVGRSLVYYVTTTVSQIMKYASDYTYIFRVLDPIKMWRQKWQDRDERETQYPSDDIISGCVSSTHSGGAALEPFTNLRVIDALSNLYTDELYEYGTPPSCTAAKPDCGSPYLFCSLSNVSWWETADSMVKCMAKILPGGSCGDFVKGESPCYQGKCVNGNCVLDLGIDGDDVQDIEIPDSSDEKEGLDPELPDEKPDVKFATNANQKSTGRFGLAMDRDAAINAHCHHRRVQRRKLAVLRQENHARKQRLNRGPMGITQLHEFAKSLTTAQQALKNTSAELHEAQKKLKELIGTASPNCHYKKLPLTKAVRKEYHTLTDVERNRYHAALKTLKKKGVYDVFATFHAKASNAMNAHHGPAFLPWHRELLKRYELELRKIDPRVSLPYWLSSVNNYAPREPDFPWRSRQQITFSGPITRNAGDRNAYFVLTNAALILEYATDYTWVFRTPPPYMESCTTDWFKSTQPSFEVYHGYGHMTVGGDMNTTATAGADPLFFMHHANYDQLFETWRQKWQDRDERETQYPSDDIISECTSATHQAAVAMEPFTNLRVIDGLSNLYTDELYEYAPAPSCSAEKPDCGSPYLFCSLSNTTWWETQVPVNCLAKMMPGGECSHFVSGEKPCYQGKCVNGICVVRFEP
ncbi:unnamed protein product, partial [Mesorhabditis spiculigera]